MTIVSLYKSECGFSSEKATEVSILLNSQIIYVDSYPCVLEKYDSSRTKYTHLLFNNSSQKYKTKQHYPPKIKK